MRRPALPICLLIAASLAPVGTAWAQPGASTPRASASTLPAFEGPPAPTLPDTISRDATDKVTVRGVRLDAPLDIDGRLDEDDLPAPPPDDGFIQQEPHEGAARPPRGTEVWVLFDDHNALRQRPLLGQPAPNARSSTNCAATTTTSTQNENFTVVIDTFHDRRNGFVFQTNPLGALRDGYITDERVHNVDWNTVWDVQVARDRPGLDDRDGHPVQVAALSGQRRAGLGHQLPARRAVEERVVVPDADAGGLGASAASYKASPCATLVGLETPAPVAEPRAQAVRRSRRVDDRQRRVPPAVERRRRRTSGFDFESTA